MQEAPYEKVLRESTIPACDHASLVEGMRVMLHRTGDAGRPSDAMRSQVSLYGRIGREDYLRRLV